jgi:hypothetical protein
LNAALVGESKNTMQDLKGKTVIRPGEQLIATPHQLETVVVDRRGHSVETKACRCPYPAREEL